MGENKEEIRQPISGGQYKLIPTPEKKKGKKIGDVSAHRLNKKEKGKKETWFNTHPREKRKKKKKPAFLSLKKKEKRGEETVEVTNAEKGRKKSEYIFLSGYSRARNRGGSLQSFP